jgi:two-component sensor histidine kinase
MRKGTRAGRTDIAGKETDLPSRGRTDLFHPPQTAGKDLGDALAEKDALLREVLHQIKNHLQVIASLLSLQSESIKDNRVLRLFRESQNRVRAISLVYEKLYQSGSTTRIDFADYIQALALHLVHSLEIDPNRVRLRMDLRKSLLDIRTAIPCGLIVNELVSNALQHAFPGARAGTIQVGLRPFPGRTFKLVVADNGVGWPVRLDPRQAKTLGLQIVTMLTNQVEGSLTLKKAKGTRFELVFRQLKYRTRV